MIRICYGKSMNLQSLPDSIIELKNLILAINDSHVSTEKKYQARIEFLEERVRLLQKELFGRKTEKQPAVDQKQLYLFNETESGDMKEAEEPSVVLVPEHTRGKKGRKPLPDHLPRVDVIHDVTEAEKICACGAHKSRIGEEVSEQLDYEPAKIKVIRNIRPKYACKQCEGVEGQGPVVAIAPAPPQLIPKSNATSGLLAHILISKFEDALPFYRQEKIFARLGIDLPRATMCGWAVKISELLKPILALLRQEILSGPLINIDETVVQVLNEPGRSNTSKSYMWVFRGGNPDRPALVYQYHPTRSGQVPLEYLSGYRGYVQTDAYSGYDALGRRKGIVLLGCWSHARRKFIEVVKAQSDTKRKGSADEALGYIGRLYKIESEAKESGYPAEEMYRVRQERSKPILAEFKNWLIQKSVVTPPKGLLGKAINYSLGNWERLERYIEDGRLRPDNNLAENAIRPFVVGRKNWLFSGHPNGAAASAAIYSLIETAKANNLKPYEYVRCLFDRLPLAATEEDYRELLPQNIDPPEVASAA